MKYARYLIALVVGWGLIAGVPAGAQSLADAAKKEKERRKKVEKEKKVRVITQKDIEELRKKYGLTETRPAPAPTRRTVVREEEREQRQETKEKYLERYQQVKLEIARKRQQIQKLEQELNILTTGYLGSVFPQETQSLLQEIARKRDEIAKLKQEIREKEAELRRIVREARRAGVLPGDFRKADREIQTRLGQSSGRSGTS